MCLLMLDKSHSLLDIRGMNIRKCSDIFPLSWRLRCRSLSVCRTTICLRITGFIFFITTPLFLSSLFSSCVLLMPHSGFTWREENKLFSHNNPFNSSQISHVCRFHVYCSRYWVSCTAARLSWVAVYFLMQGDKSNVFLSLIGAAIMNTHTHTHTRRQAVKHPCENNAHSPLILWKI